MSNTRDERRFLHDLSTPMSTVFFLLDMTLERLQAEPEKNEEEIKMIQGAVRSMQTAKDLISRRRELLISEDEVAGQS